MESITLIKDSIHRPDEPRHFMEYLYPSESYNALLNNGITIASSNAVLKLCEVGMHIYDPVIYFPLKDARMDYLIPSSKSSHCPLKGDTNYFDFKHDGEIISDVGWCYSKPLSFATTLSDYVAFDRRQVTVAPA